MAYLYRHIRLDKNEPFYIGIGKDNKEGEYHYNRAKSRNRRNNHWKNIISKTEYEVEIVLDNITWDEACNQEKWWINFYGRRDLGTGSLVNMTNGGEGSAGHKYICTNESREKLKKSRALVKTTEETKNKMKETWKKYYSSDQSIKHRSNNSERMFKNNPSSDPIVVQKIREKALKRVEERAKIIKWIFVNQSTQEKYYVGLGKFNNFCLEHNLSKQTIKQNFKKSKFFNYRGWDIQEL